MCAVAVEGAVGGLVIVFAIAFIYWWASSFVFMMCLSDSDLPGRHDKVLWFITFLMLSLLAPLLFSMWKRAYLEARQAR